jgi:hypothetical protein
MDVDHCAETVQSLDNSFTASALVPIILVFLVEFAVIGVSLIVVETLLLLVVIKSFIVESFLLLIVL